MLNFRENLLCWYPFKKDSSILEIYAEESCFNDATSIRLEDIDNIDNRYDYIILNGVIRFVDFNELLKRCLDLLNDNGHILVAIENKLGSKYLSGYKDEYNHESFSFLNGSNHDYSYTRKELIDVISGYNYRFYYPYPDYRNAYEIFTDNSINKIAPSSIDNSLIEDSVLLFDNTDFTMDLYNNGCLDVFSNSFLIDLSNDTVENDIDYVKVSFNRRNEFKLYTVIDYKNNKVYKKSFDDDTHIKSIENNDWNIGKLETLEYRYIDDCLVCDLISGKTLASAVRDDIKLLDTFKENILKGEYRKQIDDVRFNEVFGEEKVDKNLHWLDRANIDILLDNIFVLDDRWIIIDPEWVFDFDIPSEFILYRSLKDTEYRDYLDFDKEVTDVFDKWDNHFVYNYVGTQIIDYKGKEFVSLDDLYQKSIELVLVNKKVYDMENSTIWKSTSGLRKILDKRKK